MEKKQNPLYTVSILTYNQKEILQRCLKSVIENSIKCEILVTVNGSIDGTSEWLLEYSKENNCVIPIINEENIGFLRGQNNALKLAKGKYFIPLNDDCTVGENWLSIMSKALEENQNIAQVGPRGSCNCLNVDGIGIPSMPGQEEYIEGSCFMIKTELFRKFGGFDEGYKWFYFDDSDLSLRLREAGFKIKALPNVPFKHLHCKTIGTKPELIKLKEETFEENRKRFLWRWGTYLKKRSFAYEIQLIRKDAFGDVLLLTPIIKEIKRRFPLSILTVSTICGEILEGNPYIDHIIKEVGKEYDFIYNLNGVYEKEPDLHILDAYSRETGIIPKDKKPEIFLTKQEEIFGSIVNNSGWVALDLGRSWECRTWEREKWGELIIKLQGMGLKVLSLSNFREESIGEDLNLGGFTTKKQAAAIIRNCSLFIGCDSLLAHIAQCLNIPCVILFGCTDPEKRIVRGAENVFPIYDNSLECKFCLHRETAVKAIKCPKGSNECMGNIKPKDVIELLKNKNIIGKRGRKK